MRAAGGGGWVVGGGRNQPKGRKKTTHPVRCNVSFKVSLVSLED